MSTIVVYKTKKEPTKMEKLLIELCDSDADFSDVSQIADLVSYARDNM
jgi:hypothetical protein